MASGAHARRCRRGAIVPRFCRSGAKGSQFSGGKGLTRSPPGNSARRPHFGFSVFAFCACDLGGIMISLAGQAAPLTGGFGGDGAGGGQNFSLGGGGASVRLNKKKER